jgi:hypothetical protein
MVASSYEVGVSLSASGAAGGLAVALLNPLDTLKVRYQVTEGTTASLSSFARSVVSSEGLVRGLWAPGVVPNALGIGISSMGRVGCYPFVRDLMVGQSSSEKPSALTMFGAGLVAGGAGYFVSSPVYQVKTLAQAEAGLIGADGILTTGARKGHAAVHHGKSLLSSLRTLASEGALFRGAGALVARGALLSAGQQLGYDGMKTECRRSGLLEEGPVLHVAASVAGALGATVFSTPADVVMTRYQAAAAAGNTNGMLDCIATIHKQQGPLGFYRGFLPFFVRLCPVFLISLPLTEHLRKLFGLGYM